MKLKIKHMIFLSSVTLFSLSIMFFNSVHAEGFSDITRTPTELNEEYIRLGVDVHRESLQEVFYNVDGLDKQRVKDLFGYPNDPLTASGSSDDFWVQDKWFYNINLPLSKDDNLVCQAKLTFSEGQLNDAEWRRYQCKVLFEGLGLPKQEVLSFEADVLFGFDSDIVSFEGKNVLSQAVSLATENFEAPSFLVIGHTDHLGSATYNMELSEKRAKAVEKAMVQRGFLSRNITSLGRGENEPVTSCQQNIERDLLIKCLAPNRRVEIILQETSNDSVLLN